MPYGLFDQRSRLTPRFIWRIGAPPGVHDAVRLIDRCRKPAQELATGMIATHRPIHSRRVAFGGGVSMRYWLPFDFGAGSIRLAFRPSRCAELIGALAARLPTVHARERLR